MFCPYCGLQNGNGSRFCAGCGSPLANNMYAEMTRSREEAEYYISEIPKLLPPLNTIANYESQIDTLNSNIYREKTRSPKKGYKLTAIAWAIPFAILAVLTYSDDGGFSDYFFMALGCFGFVSPLVLGFIIFYLVRRGRIGSYTAQIRKATIARDQVMSGIREEVCILPQNYRFYMAAKYMYEDFVSGKADTMKEAIHSCDKKLAQKRREEYEKENLRMNMQISSDVNRMSRDVKTIKIIHILRWFF